MGLLSRIDKSSVNFEETKYLAALTAPLVRRGTMRYVRPDRLEMQVDKPYFERLEIVGDRLTIENRDGNRQIDLASQPLAGVLVEGLRAVLAGDLAGLARHYRYRFEGEIGAWKLELEPLDKDAAAAVRRIDIDGSKAQLSRISIEEPQGDRTDLRLVDAPAPRNERASSEPWDGSFWSVLALAYAATRVSIESDFSVFLPRGINDSQRTFLAQLRNGAVSRLVLIALENDDPQALAKLSAACRNAREGSDASTYVNNGGSDFAQRELNSIAALRYVLSDRVTSDRFSADGLRAALEKRLEGLAGSAGAFEKTLLASDPTGETLHVLQRLTPDRQPRRIDDAWFDESGTSALLVAETRAAGSDLAGQDEALKRLGDAFADVRGGGKARMRYSSPGAMAVESRSLIAADVAWLSLLSTVLILVILGCGLSLDPCRAGLRRAGAERASRWHRRGELLVRQRARHRARLRRDAARRGGRLPELSVDAEACRRNDARHARAHAADAAPGCRDDGLRLAGAADVRIFPGWRNSAC